MSQHRSESMVVRMLRRLMSITAQTLDVLQPRQANSSNAAVNILVVELWNIGDVILAMPFLARLREKLPQARITLLAQPFAVDLLRGTKLVDDIITVRLDWTGRNSRTFAHLLELVRVAYNVRRRDFDRVYSARTHLREHLLVALSGVPQRVGIIERDMHHPFTERKPIGEPRGSRVAEWLMLLGDERADRNRFAPVPRLVVSEAERGWASVFLGGDQIKEHNLIVGIHPGASLTEKRWPLERFRGIAAELTTHPGIRVVVFAEPPPSGYGRELFDVPHVTPAQTTLRQLIALIDRCDLLVCNDSGPMHIAGALGVPVVAMFGAGIESWFAPLGEGHILLHPHQPALASPSGIRSPASISLDQAQEAVRRALKSLRRIRLAIT